MRQPLVTEPRVTDIQARTVDKGLLQTMTIFKANFTDQRAVHDGDLVQLRVTQFAPPPPTRKGE